MGWANSASSRRPLTSNGEPRTSPWRKSKQHRIPRRARRLSPRHNPPAKPVRRLQGLARHISCGLTAVDPFEEIEQEHGRKWRSRYRVQTCVGAEGHFRPYLQIGSEEPEPTSFYNGAISIGAYRASTGGRRVDTGPAALRKNLKRPVSRRPSAQSRWRKQFPHGLLDFCTTPDERFGSSVFTRSTYTLDGM